MKAEIITIGDEILIGQTIDTNSAWIGEELNKIGVEINRITSIQDVPEEISKATDEAFERVDLVLMTGGLGPTLDDKTKKTLTAYFKDELVMNEEVLETIENYFTSRGLPILEMNRQQAMLPSRAQIVRNHKGSASGMWFERNGGVLLAMPGVPGEMKHILQNGGLRKIQDHFVTLPVYHRTILTNGAGESFMSNMVKDWEEALEGEGISLAYLPSPGLVRIRLTARGEDAKAIKIKVDEKAAELKELLSEYVFGEDKETLEGIVGDLLKAKRMTLATAESCTGGYIAHKLTSVPGSSAYYEGSFITYSYDLKSAMLGVNRDVILEKGAVSEEVVLQMAKGVQEGMNVDYAIAVSGIAGPEGGTEDKPVGTVWMALATPKGTEAKKFQFGRNRLANIRMTALSALNWLRKELLAS
ncbi:MAG: competence/damage-inducible protein A [Flavobacteriales bacterium]|nr:competence/damage-inducible protein A [Flavobacteriales bacterium]